MAYENKDLFNFMKGLGQFKEYADYEDYRKRRFGIAQEPSDSFNEFKKNLPEKELKQFNEVFGEDEN